MKGVSSNEPGPSGGRPPQDRAEFVRRLLIALLLIVLLLVAWRLLDLLLLVFGAVLMAVLLRAISDPLARRTGVTPGWSLTVTVLALLALILLVGWLFGAQIRSQIEGLSTTLPVAWRSLQARLQETEAGRQLLHWIQTTAFGPATSRYLGRFLISLTNGIGGLVVIVVGGIYLAAQPELYRRGMLLLVPRTARKAAAETIDKTAGALRLWLLGQLAIMAIVGVLTGLGAWIIGLPSALALGLIAGLLEFIPFLGPILTAVPALILGLAIGPQTALLTLLLLLLVQQAEGNVITPLVQREAVTLPPALTLFALIAMGLLFGPLGLLLSAPLAVVAYVAVGELYVRRTLGEDSGRLDAFADSGRHGGTGKA